MGNPVIPPPPEGFTVEDQKVEQESFSIPAPPSGFTEKQEPLQELPAPPEGFTELVKAPQMPGILEAGAQGLITGLGDVAQSGQVLSGQTPAVEAQSPAATPFDLQDLAHPIDRGLPKVAYKLAASSPMLAGGIAGGVVGGAAGPLGTIAGGAAGAGIGAAAQTLGPIYAEELAKNPNDKEAAWDRALKHAATGGAFSSAGWAAFPVKFFQGPVKQLVFQLSVVQPSIMVNQKIATNVIDNKPLNEGAREAYVEGAVLGAVPAIGQGVVSKIGRALERETPRLREETPLELKQPSFKEEPLAAFPLKKFRDRVLGKKPDSEDTFELQKAKPLEDVYETSLIFAKTEREFKAKERQEEELSRQEYEHADKLPRYVLEDESNPRLLTGTDLELELALRGNDPVRPLIKQIDSNTLEADKITADVFNLPEWGDKRIFTPDPLFESEYKLVQELSSINPEQAVGKYKQLFAQGLRVLPLPNESFFYLGGYKAAQIKDIPKSSRSSFEVSQTQDGVVVGEYTKGSFVEQQPPIARTKTVSVDLSLLEPDTFVSSAPYDARYLPLELSRAKRDEWKSAAFKEDFKKIKELYNEGVFVPVKELTPNGLLTDSRSTMVAVKEIPPRALTQGYAAIPYVDRYNLPGTDGERARHTIEGVFVKHDPQGSVASRARANEIATIVSELKPVFDKIIKNFGAKNKLRFEIYEGGTGSPIVYVYNNVIVIPGDFAKGNPSYFAGGVKEGYAQIIAHEVGHLVTLRSWEKLPEDVKSIVQDQYQRALLDFNIRQDVSTFESYYGAERSGKSHYHLSFSEWLAEQFRRYVSSDKSTLLEFEHFFREGGQNFKNVKDQVARELGEAHAKQKFQSSWAFNSWMDYLEAAAREGISPLQLALRSHRTALDYPIPHDMVEATAAVSNALAEFKQLIAEGVEVKLDERAEIDSGSTVYGHYDHQNQALRLMIGSLAFVNGKENKNLVAKQVVAHEAFHSVEQALSRKQVALLVEKSKEAKLLTEKTEQSYKEYFAQEFKRLGVPKEEVARYTQQYLNSEHMALLVEERVAGRNFDKATDGLLDKISRFVEKVGNLLRGKGFTTADDILHSFFRGEITRQFNAAKRNQKDRNSVWQRAADVAQLTKIREDVYAKHYDLSRESQISSSSRKGTNSFIFYDKQGKAIASLDTAYRSDGRGHEIDMIRVRDRKWFGEGLPAELLGFAERILGAPFKTAGTFTEAGYKMVKRVDPERVKYYTFDQISKFWYSPKFIWEQIAKNQRLSELGKGKEVEYQAIDLANLKHWKKLAEKIPDVAKDDPILAKQWSLRETELEGYRKSEEIKKAKLVKDLTGEENGLVEDPYEAIGRNSQLQAEAKNALITGYTYGAAPQPELRMMRKLFDKYGEKDPEVGKLLSGNSHYADKLVKTARTWYSIRQLAWVNPHISELRSYISLRDQQHQRGNEWVTRADKVAKEWDVIGEKQRDGVTELLFWATEMKYRSRVEEQQKIVRQPTQQEVIAKAKMLGLDQKSLLLYAKIGKEFRDFLTQMEGVFSEQINRRFTSPLEKQVALAKLATDMQNLKSKPYFPMVRFGEFTVTVRDPQTQKIDHFSAYQTKSERDAAVKLLYKQYAGGRDISVSKMPENVGEFQGLPGPLLEQIKQNLPGLDQKQKDWLDKFSHLMSPEQSFKKRWLERKGTPGYSLDGIRAFAQYFRSASRYLARIEFKDQIQEQIKSLEDGVGKAKDGTRRQIIVETLKEHAEWMDTPGKDWVNFRALVTHFHLGFSFSSAFINLTQVPVVTYPYLSSIYGEKAVLALAGNSMNSAARTMNYTNKNSSPGFLKAHEEMVNQGKIDTGQAAELGSFAESSRLDKGLAGTKAQKGFRTLTHMSMFGFGKTERLNREWTFKTAWDLALADPTNKHNLDLASGKATELYDLIARTKMTFEEGTAFLVAREAIDRTQGVYQAWDRPKFMRGKVPGALSIFLSFTQQTMFQLAHNPGRAKMFLMLGALYGMSGLPGAQDIDNAVKLIARKLFGKDFSLLKFTREQMVGLTKGTVASEVGPDLFLHGISRYSFGAGLLGEGLGIPQFDASGSGSMGELIPGLSPLLKGVANSSAKGDAWKNITSEVAKDLSGPGVGLFYAWLQFASANPFSADQKKWEKILPRAAKNISKANRYAYDGKETNSAGAEIAHFNMSDPDDRATVIAQALGFTPRKITEYYEAQGEVQSKIAFYKTRKNDLLLQLSTAIGQQSKEAQADVITGIKAFNAELKLQGSPELSITSQQLQASMRSRAKAKALQSQGLPTEKRLIPLARKTRELYPGVILEQKKVK